MEDLVEKCSHNSILRVLKTQSKGNNLCTDSAVTWWKSIIFTEHMGRKWMVWITFTILIGLLLLKKYGNYLRSVLLALRLSGPPAIPILGNVLLINNYKELEKLGKTIHTLHFPIARTWMFFVPIFIIYQPSHLKIIMSRTRVSEKNFLYGIMHTFIGNGLIVSKGNKWKNNRRQIQPHFQTNLLEGYCQYFAEISQEMVHILSTQKRVQITNIINTWILKILHKTVLGIDLENTDQTPFRKSELFLVRRILRPWLLFDSLFRKSSMFQEEEKHSSELQDYVGQIIKRRRNERRKGQFRNVCLLNKFIEQAEQSQFTEEDILNETITFMLAGFDSVASAIVFCLYYLAKYEDIQEKVFKEINEITLDGNFVINKAEQVHQMYYLEQCIKETLRLMPSLPLISRVLLSEVTLDEYTLPAGTNIFISPYLTHRLPYVFPEPEKFDPDRFSNINKKTIHPFGYLPFSLGPRNCIGYRFAYLEMKIIIGYIIQNYRIDLRDQYKELEWTYKVTLRAKGGLWLSLNRRDKSHPD